jgi:hypothetical protein
LALYELTFCTEKDEVPTATLFMLERPIDRMPADQLNSISLADYWTVANW